MDITGRNGWHWAQTRVAQIVLFWGVLELILRTLDAATKSDMLRMLRESLGPDLRFMSDPWLAAILVPLALAVLSSRGSGPGRPEKPEEMEATPKEGYSVAEAAAIPFFLAFVCGVVFPAFESSYPNRPQVVLRPNVPALSANAGRVMPRRQRPANAEGAGIGGGETGPAREPLARSLPQLTPALDADTVSAAAQNPLKVAFPESVTTEQKGDGTDNAGARTAEASQQDARNRMEQARREKNWRLLASLSESAIADRPRWVEAHWYAGEAYVHLGETARAIERLEYVTGQGAGKAEDRTVVAHAAQLLQFLKQQSP
ncbi:MAG TPA: hypothetical protein VKU44_08190 [Terriglobia bacterium]|nr:hypothetical protein [Terriglobia bacterium]